MIVTFDIGDSDRDVHDLMQLYGLTHEHGDSELACFIGLNAIRIQVSPYGTGTKFVSLKEAAFPVI